MTTFEITRFSGLKSSVVLFQTAADQYRVEIHYADPAIEHLSRVYHPVNLRKGISQFHTCVEHAIQHEEAMALGGQEFEGHWEAAYDGWMDAQAEQDRVVRQALKDELRSRL